MYRWIDHGALMAAAAALTLSAPQASAAPASETMTGCLEKAGMGFALDASGKHHELEGNLGFAKHAGHTVKVTGEQHGDSFHATALEHVSPNCDTSATPKTAAKHLDASDQGTSEADRATTAKIRRAIVDDDSLSTYAHNVMIVTRDGHVTLRGAVPSIEEKAAVAAKAEAVLGDAIDNQLTVKPDSN